jgi:hypothetical protein
MRDFYAHNRAERIVRAVGALIMLTVTMGVLSGCLLPNRSVVSRSADDVNIVRVFMGEVGYSTLALKRDTFNPRDLTFKQLEHLTPTDPDFTNAQFLVLNREWSYQESGKVIVIVCTQGRSDAEGQRKYFAGYNSGDYGWITEDTFAALRLGDYTPLPKMR